MDMPYTNLHHNRPHCQPQCLLHVTGGDTVSPSIKLFNEAYWHSCIIIKNVIIIFIIIITTNSSFIHWKIRDLQLRLAQCTFYPVQVRPMTNLQT